MSATQQGLDAKKYLSGWLMGLAGMYQKDIRAIPEDKWEATFGGVTRSAAQATADTIGMLGWTAEALKGNVVLTDESYVTGQVREQCSTREGASALLESNVNAFVAALNAASDEALNSMVTPPWRLDMPLFALCHVAVSHVWYHDGQLNYIQMLLGDGEVHWM